MSMRKTTFLITGLDIQNMLTDKWEEWSFSNAIEKFNQSDVKIICDFMGGEYIYLGYVHVCAEEDEDITETFDFECGKENNRIIEEILISLGELRKLGVVEDKVFDIKPKQILFTHWEQKCTVSFKTFESF